MNNSLPKKAFQKLSKSRIMPILVGSPTSENEQGSYTIENFTALCVLVSGVRFKRDTDCISLRVANGNLKIETCRVILNTLDLNREARSFPRAQIFTAFWRSYGVRSCNAFLAEYISSISVIFTLSNSENNGTIVCYSQRCLFISCLDWCGWESSH